MVEYKPGCFVELDHGARSGLLSAQIVRHVSRAAVTDFRVALRSLLSNHGE